MFDCASIYIYIYIYMCMCYVRPGLRSPPRLLSNPRLQAVKIQETELSSLSSLQSLESSLYQRSKASWRRESFCPLSHLSCPSLPCPESTRHSLYVSTMYVCTVYVLLYPFRTSCHLFIAPLVTSTIRLRRCR